ncbi:MAG: hypothetical protein ACQR33_06050 [Candidatus Saccharibacteria bacterium]
MDIHTKTISPDEYDPIFDDGSDSEIIGRARVEPGEMSSLVLGVYENDFPQPEFHLEVSPRNASVSASLIRIDDGGEYKLSYHFQNFQSIACTVTVRKCLAA